MKAKNAFRPSSGERFARGLAAVVSSGEVPLIQVRTGCANCLHRRPMPDADTLLSSLTALAADHRLVAQAWHGALLLAAIAWLGGWRPRPSFSLALLALPFASAGLLALADGASFNGIVMSAAAAACVGLSATQRADGGYRRDRILPRSIALLMLAFAWGYPHFAPTPWFPAGLYSSPIGVLPCPTLALAIGVGLLLGGFGSRAATCVFVALGLFYGAVGVLVLGVAMDGLLLAGALALAGQDWLQHRSPRRHP
jgi:hypothetical protein